MENAQLARYPALAEEAARMLLMNRALATALIQLHSNHSRYVDLCRFLDDKVAAMVDEAIRFELHEPSEGSEEEEPPKWTGQPATCAGKTLKGSPCTKPSTLEQDWQPFCSRHYPRPASYYEECERNSRAWSDYFHRRRGALERYHDAERMISGLSAMHGELAGALRALGIPEPTHADRTRPPAERTVNVDGLIFELVSVHGRPNETYVRRPAASDSGLIQQVPGRGWAATSSIQTRAAFTAPSAISSRRTRPERSGMRT